MKPAHMKTFDLTVWLLPLHVLVLGIVDLMLSCAKREVIRI